MLDFTYSYKILAVTPQEIFSLEEIKNYLRVTANHDDKLIEVIIESAIDIAENFTNISLKNRNIECTLEPQNHFKKHLTLPYSPLQKINSIYYLQDSKKYEIASTDYIVNDKLGLIFNSQVYSYQEIIINYLSGLETVNIPAGIKQGMLLHTGEMYDRETQNPQPFSNIIQSLYLPYKNYRL